MELAAYLDPTFAMPRLHLGLLARRAGDEEASLPSSGSSWAELAARYQRRREADTTS